MELPTPDGEGVTSVPPALRRLLRRAKYAVGDQPALMPLFLRLTPEGTRRAITDKTDIVIEGFPRSGNTFAVFALRDANPQLSVASHIHHHGPIRIAAKRNLPLLVVIREPVECLSSYLIAGPHGQPQGVLEEYCSYHWALRETGSAAVIATFDQVTTGYAEVIERLRARFKIDLVPYTNSPEADARVFDGIKDDHARIHQRRKAAEVAPVPHAERREIKERHAAALRDPSLSPLLAKAESIYLELASQSAE